MAGTETGNTIIRVVKCTTAVCVNVELYLLLLGMMNMKKCNNLETMIYPIVKLAFQ